MCPECGVMVDLDRPDPEREALAEILGKSLMVVGPVRVERRPLPNYGHLIGTTEGILFLPRLHRRINGAWEGVTSQRLPGWWPFQGDLSSPRFLNWLRRPFGGSPRAVNSETAIVDDSTQSLADRLLDSPGGFFIVHRSIRALTPRRRTIKLERPPLRSIAIADETEDGSLLTSLNALAAQAGWIGVRNQ